MDDHPVFRQGIAGLIQGQADMTLVGEASTGREAIRQFRTHRPDITLMDLQMLEPNGVDVTIAIRNEFPQARVIVLTTHARDVQVLRALKAGAQGYLLKAFCTKSCWKPSGLSTRGKRPFPRRSPMSWLSMPLKIPLRPPKFLSFG